MPSVDFTALGETAVFVRLADSDLVAAGAQQECPSVME